MMGGTDPNKGLVMHTSYPLLKSKPPIKDPENLSKTKMKI